MRTSWFATSPSVADPVGQLVSGRAWGWVLVYHPAAQPELVDVVVRLLAMMTSLAAPIVSDCV